MKKRLPTAIILIALLTPILILNFKYQSYEPFKLIFIILFGFFNAFATYELTKIFEKNYNINLFNKILLSLASQSIYIFFLNFKLSIYSKAYQSELFNLVFILLAIINLLLFLIINPSILLNRKNLFLFLLTIFYPSIGFGAISSLRIGGSIYILFAIAICALTDTFAYFSGMLFGKHKMAPKISPKKTWEGAVGGTTMATIICVPLFVFYHKLFNFNSNILDATSNIFKYTFMQDTKVYYQILVLIPLVIILSIIAQLGDLFASSIKRDNNIKDYSNLMPGHGGILDRFDSLIFVAVLIFLFRAFL